MASPHRSAGATRRRRELAAIHIAASELGLRSEAGDGPYRDMLFAVARVRSAADLDHAGRRAVLDHLRSRGWSPPRGPATRRQRLPRGRTARDGTTLATPDQVALIRHIWGSLAAAGELRRGDEAGLRAWLPRATRKYDPRRVGFSATEFLPLYVARDVIEQLKQWAERCAVDWRDG